MDAPSLPDSALHRLGSTAGRAPVWVSGLNAGGFLLTRQIGYGTLGQVMGTSVFAIAAPTDSAVSGELKFLTGAYRQAQTLALDRLREEARLLQADGVVGVRLRRVRLESDPRLLEFSVTGTAIRTQNRSVQNDTVPFLSALDGDDFWTLRQAGYAPLGIAIGNCVYYRVASLGNVPARALGVGVGAQNVERTDYTQAVYAARHLAMERMEADARAVRADGIVGVMLHYERTQGTENGMAAGLRDARFQFLAVGTAVARIPGTPSPSVEMRFPLG